MAFVEIQSVVAADQVGRLDRVVQGLTGRSRADVRGLFDADGVQLNGTACTEPGTIVQAGDSITIRHDPHMRYHERPRRRESTAFRVVFEDESLIVVDKAAGVLTVPTNRGETYTLIEAVNRHVSRRSRRRATIVHRLDRWTSGLLVFGKTAQVGRELQAQFRSRKAQREYAAIVSGTLAQPEGTFASRLGMTKSLQRYSVRADEEGEQAVTHYRVEKRLKDTTYARVWLETGRRNQIRVHFAEAGHPVLGDDRYRPDLAYHPDWKTRRLALHAAMLGFEHPRSREVMQFESPLPDEFARFLARRIPTERGERPV